MSVANRAIAWTNLAWRFAVHVTTRLPARLIARTNNDMARFRAAVEPEGFVPMLPEERAAFPRFMRCVHCGLCAIPQMDTPVSAWDEAWTFVSGPSRSLDHAHLVALSLPHSANRTAEAVCPTGVPIATMAATLRRMGAAAAEPHREP